MHDPDVAASTVGDDADSLHLRVRLGAHSGALDRLLALLSRKRATLEGIVGRCGAAGWQLELDVSIPAARQVHVLEALRREVVVVDVATRPRR